MMRTWDDSLNRNHKESTLNYMAYNLNNSSSSWVSKESVQEWQIFWNQSLSGNRNMRNCLKSWTWTEMFTGRGQITFPVSPLE